MSGGGKKAWLVSMIALWAVGPMTLPAWAQPDAGSLLQQQKRLDTQPQRPSEAPVLNETAPVRPSADNGVRVHVTEFVLTGEIRAFPRAELMLLLARFRDTDMGFADLQAAADTITNYYHAHGYFLARTYLPTQDVSQGIITIRVIEGEIEKDGLDIKGDSLRLDRDFARRIVLNAAKPQIPLKKADLERGILLLNDLPGVASSVNLTPGDMPGTTHATLDVREGDRFTGHASLDNFGSRYTGANRVVVGVEANDPTGHGDQLYVEYIRTLDSHYDYLKAGYSRPFGDSGFRAGIHGSFMRYKVGKEFASLALKGTAGEWGIDGRYPLIRTLNTNLYLNGSWTQQHLYNESLGAATSQKLLGFGNAGFNADHVDRFGGGGLTTGGVNWTLGRLDLGANAANLAQDQGAGGAHTYGTFSKLNWDLSRIQRSVERVTLIARLSGQIAMHNLDSAQKIQLGGPTGVRAYPTGEAAGDDGISITMEGRYLAKAGTPLGDCNLIGFYDWGRISQYHNASGITMTTPNRYSLSGFGAGLTLSKPGRYDFQLSWAKPVGSNPGRNATTGANSDGLQNGSRIWARLQLFI